MEDLTPLEIEIEKALAPFNAGGLENLVYKKACEIEKLKEELQSLQMKVGYWRCLARQRPEAHAAILTEILKTPETWEPNVKF